MKEIEFSVMEGQAGEAERLLPLLHEFEQESHIHVNLIMLPWETAWAQNVKYALYGHGPDVSAVGASWIGSLASMRALRPFTPREIHELGGEEAFFEPIWHVSKTIDDPNVWAIPWYGDVRVLYFWKDVLEKAGVGNIEEAFKTDAALVKTLEKLSRGGHPYPLALTTHAISQNLHEAAHWIWNAGGNFVSPDGKRVTFNEPKAMQGFKNYFSLCPFISPTSLQKDSGELFRDGTSPVHISGLWIPGSINEKEVKDRLGVAKIPGIAYMGGTSLAIWQYSLKNEPAFELIKFLSSRSTYQRNDLPEYSQLPTRREALNWPSTQNDPFNRVFMDAFQYGRSFPSLRLWGSIEDRLIPVLSSIWTELFANPQQDLDECLHKHLDPLAERLNTALEINRSQMNHEEKPPADDSMRQSEKQKGRDILPALQVVRSWTEAGPRSIASTGPAK